MNARNLLLELLVEELPPKALKGLGEAFGQTLLAQLRQHGLADAVSVLTVFASPRRLGAHISHVLARAADKGVSHKLMPAAVGLDGAGHATPALLKKLATLGQDGSAVGRVQRRTEGKAEVLMLDMVQPGAALAEGLQRALDEALARLPIPKVMTYQLEQGEGPNFQPGWSSVRFVRPAHGLVALHGAEVVSITALGLKAGRQTQGHRFEATLDPVVLQDADHYERQLAEQGGVIASFEHRKSEVLRQLHAAASAEGLTPVDDAALLDEVTALVERPHVVRCQFEPEFLAVPQECLILTMKANQKYFPLLDASGRLTHRFLVVSNIRPVDASRVIQGNERVVRPRLADARFFYDQDRKRPLSARVEQLERVVYHGKLGTQGQRMHRVRRLALAIAEQWAAAGHRAAPGWAQQVEQAATLAKADLLTDMVGEFPELQGTMGAYYARHDGLPEPVAQAIEDHYKPRFSGDQLPRGDVGLVLALADKLETLVGLFGVGQGPSGDKDPFALRRHALGVIRMLIERELPLHVPQLLEAAFDAFDSASAVRLQREVSLPQVQDFMLERLVGSLRDKGATAQEVDAVVALRPPQWAELPRRLAAVRAFAGLSEAPALAAANKRVANILKKSEGAGLHPSTAVRPELLQEPAERALHLALQTVAAQAERALAKGELTASLQALAALKEPVDTFFEQVMVNAQDPALRNNRLVLLGQLQRAMNQVADLGRLAT